MKKSFLSISSALNCGHGTKRLVGYFELYVDWTHARLAPIDHVNFDDSKLNVMLKKYAPCVVSISFLNDQ